LLNKDRKWQWGPSQQKAFEASKDSLTSDNLLVHYDQKEKLILSCDASPYRIGAVIQHRIGGSERPIAFASRRLNKAEVNYSRIEKEGLGIIFGVTKFRQYLLGRKFTLVTNHQPLVHLFSPAKGIPLLAASRIKRWALIPSSLNYDIEYRSSKNNANADALSRLPLNETVMDDKKDSELVLLMETIDEDFPTTSRDIAYETSKDPTLRKVVLMTMEGWLETMDPGWSEDIKPFFHRRSELSCEQGCDLWGTRVIIPPQLRKTMLMELHSTHAGIVRMKALARSILWWPKLDAELAHACTECQENAKKPSNIEPTVWQWPTAPWKRIHVDFAGPFLDHQFLVVVDAHSKWVEVEIMRNITAAGTIKALRRIFARFGLPERLVSDDGSQFTSAEFQQFLKMNNIHHTLTAPGHPATNGQAERFVQNFKNALKKMRDQSGDLDDKLQRYLLSYRTTPQCATGKSPCELLMRRSLRTRLTAIRPTPDTHRVPKEDLSTDKFRYFQPGQPVFVRNYGVHGAKWLPGVILERHGSRNYQVSVGEFVWKRHIDQLRIRYADMPAVQSGGATPETLVIPGQPLVEDPTSCQEPSSSAETSAPAQSSGEN
jgi:hypothetical protein